MSYRGSVSIKFAVGLVPSSGQVMESHDQAPGYSFSHTSSHDPKFCKATEPSAQHAFPDILCSPQKSDIIWKTEPGLVLVMDS